MRIELSYKIRAIVYVLVVIGTAILVPLNAGGVVSELVMNVWTSLAGAASMLAALNVTRD